MESIDLENILDFSKEVNCSVIPRWRRKALEKQNLVETPTKV